MKKVFMSAAIVALMAVAVSCGSNNNKKAEAAAEEAKVEEVCEEACEKSKTEEAIEAGKEAVKEAVDEKGAEVVNAAANKAVEALK